MTRVLKVLTAGPGVSIQDQGRPGYLDRGLSRSGAADRLALFEGAALLSQSGELAALEMAGFGGEFQADTELRIALTGAPMRAAIGGEPVAWSASHLLPAGSRLSIGAAHSGVYGYLHVGGGFDTPAILGSRSYHRAAGLGAPVSADDALPVGRDKKDSVGDVLDVEDRFSGGTIRILHSFQTALFPTDERRRFEETEFQRDMRANRMGVRLMPLAEGFHTEGGLNVLSEIIVPGDIQVTGDGTPFVLLPECQTTGGYPRIGTVLPCDMPRFVQAPSGAALRFRFVDLENALAEQEAFEKQLLELQDRVRPLFRDPHDIGDLLSYQLISGAIAGDED